MMAILLTACLAPEPQWDGDTLTLTSIYVYWGFETLDSTDDVPQDPGPDTETTPETEPDVFDPITVVQ